MHHLSESASIAWTTPREFWSGSSALSDCWRNIRRIEISLLLYKSGRRAAHIKRYHDLLGEVEAEADRINWRFQNGSWRPIVYLKRQFSHEEVEKYYRAADVCLVTSLHDGMNLVAKEFLAARDDEQGVLILSRFTGAARELNDALIVNPYDIEQMAEAIRIALELPAEERQA